MLQFFVEIEERKNEGGGMKNEDVIELVYSIIITVSRSINNKDFEAALVLLHAANILEKVIVDE